MWRPVRRAFAVVAAAVILAGCASASPPSPPSGVDGLEIPTPSPDPADFAGAIDNPWLPLSPGATWTYAVTDDPEAGPTTVTAEVGPTIAGVDTVAVSTVPPGSSVPVTDWYAQDRHGNVWWFGREGEWEAGVAGARAGLAMAATPRFGDGYRSALGIGVDVRAEVVGLEGSADVQAGTYDDLVVIDTTTPDGAVVRSSYAEGVGLVQRTPPGDDVSGVLGLVSYRP